MRLKLISFIVVIYSISIACQKEEMIRPKEYPYVYIDKIEIKTDDFVSFNARIAYMGAEEIIDHGFIIKDLAINPEFELTIIESMGLADKNEDQFSFTLDSGLVKGMDFSVRAFTMTTSMTVYSNEESFTSPIGGY